MQTTTNPNARAHRVGLIVPSSNTTMETEIPELLRRQSIRTGAAFTFHSARLRLLQVTPEALQAMNACATDAVDALADAQVDCMMYACLVAAMHGGRQSVEETTARLGSRALSNGSLGPVITSAGALVQALRAMGVARAAMITPYRKALTQKVAGTLGEYGIEVTHAHSLGGSGQRCRRPARSAGSHRHRRRHGPLRCRRADPVGMCADAFAPRD